MIFDDNHLRKEPGSIDKESLRRGRARRDGTDFAAFRPCEGTFRRVYLVGAFDPPVGAVVCRGLDQ